MGVFDNAQTITINGKEVQSLKIGNNTLYQKALESNTLFEDSCSSNANLSKYNSPVSLYQTNVGGSPSLSYNSSNNCYVFTNNSSNDWLLYTIPALDGKTDFTLSAEFKVDSNSGQYVGLGVMPSASSLSSTYAEIMYSYRYNASQIYAYAQRRRRTNSSSNLSTGRVSQSPTTWFKMEMVFNSGNGVTFNWKTTSDSSLKTYSSTVSASANDRHYGILLKSNSTSYNCYVRNIKAEKN